ncbi:MAG: fumarylacetoacetate hydrolase family protein [Anaerolineae bacterium]|nr:fumarylacetoacetate hydrolase family protein [Anaerolineae bacterium]
MTQQLQRWVRVAPEGVPVWGLLEENSVYRVSGTPYGAWQRAEVLGVVPELALLAPVMPSKIVCVGRNYAAHAAEHNAEVPKEPLLFLKPPSSVIGPNAPILHPALSQRVEHEAELAIVIGQRCHAVVAERAWDCVLGVTCANDVTARDLQRSDQLWTRGKGFDTFCPLGPWVVTGVTAADFVDVAISCRVNGATRQAGRTSEMVFTPAEIIAYITQVMTLEPGDVVLTGTPAGVSRLYPGDVVEVEIETIGCLRNPVAMV